MLELLLLMLVLPEVLLPVVLNADTLLSERGELARRTATKSEI